MTTDKPTICSNCGAVDPNTDVRYKLTNKPTEAILEQAAELLKVGVDDLDWISNRELELIEDDIELFISMNYVEKTICCQCTNEL